MIADAAPRNWPAAACDMCETAIEITAEITASIATAGAGMLRMVRSAAASGRTSAAAAPGGLMP
jgi:hypothetical protein